MPVLTEKNKADLKSRFDKELTGLVTLRHFTQRMSQLILPGAAAAPQSAQGSQLLRQAREILEEMAAQAPDKIKVEVYDLVSDRPKLAEYRVAQIPCTTLDSAGRARFYGIPSGYEFTTIVQAVIDASRGSTPLREPTRKALAQLEKDVNLKVFVTPTWPYCPRAASLAVQMAMESPRVTAEVIEATEFPDLAQAYQVMAVPRTVINDAVVFDGAVPENLFLDAILQSVGKPALTDQGGGPVIEEVDTGDQGGLPEEPSP